MNKPTKSDIYLKWSPYMDDEFILVGNSISFYKIFSLEPSNVKSRIENNIFITENTYAKIFASINNYPKEKLLSWYPNTDPNGLNIGFYTLALHEFNDNQIKIISLSSEESNNYVDIELATLNINENRQSNQLEWNLKNSYLGLGFEKLNDTSKTICIWDALHSTNPIYQLEETETCKSLAWTPESPHILFAATSDNKISLFDLRSGLKAKESINSEFINGWTLDSKNPIRAASFCDNKVAIWDLRYFKDYKLEYGIWDEHTCNQLSFIEESRHIRKIEFCPAKSDRLAVLTENSTEVNVYRLEGKKNTIKSVPIEYLRYSKGTAILNSFSWHSKDPNRLMVTSSTFNALMDLSVVDFCCIGFSYNDYLNIEINDKIAVMDIIEKQIDTDIGIKMKQRAIKSYGVQDFLLNINLLTRDDSENDVEYLWRWFDCI